MSLVEKELMEAITNEVPSIVLIKNYKGQFVYGNKTLANLYNTTVETLLGKSDEDFNPNKEQTDFYLKNIQKIMDSGQTEVVIETSADAISKKIRHYQSVKKPFINSNGEKHILVIANDITSMIEEKKTLAMKQQRLDVALNIIGEGVWDWDMSTNQVAHNHYWCEMLGLDDSRLEHSLDFFAHKIYEEDKDVVFQRIQNAIANNKPFESIHRLVHESGKAIWVHDRGKIISYDANNNPTRMIGSVKNITLEKEIEKKDSLLEQQTRLATMGEMIGNIAHQWKQPLSVIQSVATGVQVSMELENLQQEALQEYMNTIKRHVQYLSQTIEDFRNFIKNDRKKKSYNLLKAIETSINIVNASLKNNHITLIHKVYDDAVLKGFETEIVQAVINIINNAKDALVSNSIEKKYIFISSCKSEDGKTITLKIYDNGGGIPQEVLPKIFEPYFTTKDETSGTGLGLHICKKIIEQNNDGILEVYNKTFEYDNTTFVGANFSITLNL